MIPAKSLFLPWNINSQIHIKNHLDCIIYFTFYVMLLRLKALSLVCIYIHTVMPNDFGMIFKISHCRYQIRNITMTPYVIHRNLSLLLEFLWE